jgi:aldehyde dehydrogenase (NAD+)
MTIVSSQDFSYRRFILTKQIFYFTVRKAAGFAAASIFGNQGQSCCASSRVFVHEDVYERYLEFAKEIAQSLVVGDPFADTTTQGAIVSDEQFQKILGYIDSGKSEGARLVEGGSRVGEKGYFVRPTVFGDVKDTMKIAKEEVKF